MNENYQILIKTIKKAKSIVEKKYNQQKEKKYIDIMESLLNLYDNSISFELDLYQSANLSWQDKQLLFIVKNNLYKTIETFKHHDSSNYYKSQQFIKLANSILDYLEKFKPDNIAHITNTLDNFHISN